MLVSRSLYPIVQGIHLDLKRFLFMRSLKARIELSDAPVVAATQP